MGGSSSSTKHETSSNTINPMQMAQYQANYTGAQDRFGSLQPYTGPLTAGFNPTQIQAQNALTSVGNDNSYDANYGQAIGVNNGILGANLNPTITPNAITAGQLKGTDYSPYMNPYTQNVIDTTLSDIGRQRAQQGVADNASATAAHAFGGSRQAVQNALTSEAYDRNALSAVAGLRSNAFQNAQQSALSDIGNRLTADQFNSGQNVNAQQNSFNNALGLNQFRLGAANNLAALSDARMGSAARQGGILSAVGDTQQQQEQRGYTDQYNAYLQEFNRRLAEQQAYNQALGIIPLEQTSTSDGTQTTKSNPGFGGVLGSIASLGMAAASIPSGGMLSGIFGGGGGGAVSQMMASPGLGLGSTPAGYMNTVGLPRGY